MAKLATVLGLEPSGVKSLGVQVPLPAPFIMKEMIMIRHNIVPDNKAFIKWNSCQRKRAYTKISSANKVLKRMNKKETNIHVYECPFCSLYHIGHKKECI